MQGILTVGLHRWTAGLAVPVKGGPVLVVSLQLSQASSCRH
jgi:hypothetical protein